MRYELHVALVGIVLFAVAAPVSAQPTRSLRTNFEREVNRYAWEARLRWQAKAAGWDVRLRDRFHSDAFLLARHRINFRDENRLTLEARRSLGERIGGRFYGRSLWFGASRVLRQQVLAGLRYASPSRFYAEPVLGLAWDQRPGGADINPTQPAPLRRNIGPAFGVRFRTSPPSLDDYDFDLSGQSTWRVINPRRGRTTHLTGSAKRTFSSVALGARARLASFRRDTYQSTSFLNRQNEGRPLETVESTTRDTLRAALHAKASLAEGLAWTNRLNVRALRRRSRTLDPPEDALFFNTAYDRRAYDAETALRYQPRPAAMARVAVRFGAESDQRELTNRDALPLQRANETSNQLRQADYDEGFVTLTGHARVPFGSSWRLRAQATASILRHDTPTVNPDDRDEAYYQGELGVLWKLSPYLEMNLALYGATYHTVYLKALRSAENNRRRLLRVRPAVTWRPADGTRLRLEGEVRASYTRYDFVLPGRTAQDQSVRELSYDLSFRHDFGNGLLLLADGRLSDLRQGRLLRDRFAEIPYDTLRTYAGHVRLRAGMKLVAEVGLRFLVRSDYQRSASLVYASATDPEQTVRLTRPARQFVVQLGPTSRITWPLDSGHRLHLRGWLNVQRVFYHAYGVLRPAEVARIRRDAPETHLSVIPNVALTVTWDL